MAKPLLRIKARNLREKQGLSIKEIEKKLGVSRNSASLWCRDIELTPKQLKRLERRERDGAFKGRQKAAKVTKKRRLDKIAKFERQAIKQIGSLGKRELLLTGIALYWAEGDKKNRCMRFSNSDPKMILFFLKWLKEVCQIPRSRVKCSVGINQIHKNRLEEVEAYWSKIIKVPRSQFNRTSLKKVTNKKKYRNFKNHYGTLTLRVSKGTNLKYQMLGWIEAFKNQAG